MTRPVTDPSHPDWVEGASHYGDANKNYRYNPYYGFGVVDAGAAVALAEEWVLLPPMETDVVESGEIDISIPD